MQVLCICVSMLQCIKIYSHLYPHIFFKSLTEPCYGGLSGGAAVDGDRLDGAAPPAAAAVAAVASAP